MELDSIVSVPLCFCMKFCFMRGGHFCLGCFFLLESTWWKSAVRTIKTVPTGNPHSHQHSEGAGRVQPPPKNSSGLFAVPSHFISALGNHTSAFCHYRLACRAVFSSTHLFGIEFLCGEINFMVGIKEKAELKHLFKYIFSDLISTTFLWKQGLSEAIG